jgi:hypothetical protein
MYTISLGKILFNLHDLSMCRNIFVLIDNVHSLDFTLLNFYWCLSQASTCLFNCVLLLFVVVCYFQFRSFVRFIKGNITLSNNAFQPVEMNCLSHVTVQLQIRLHCPPPIIRAVWILQIAKPNSEFWSNIISKQLLDCKLNVFYYLVV